MKYRAIEPPIWCALLAGEGDSIVDMEITPNFCTTERPLIVVMGNNPSASSTPKMPEAYKLMERFPDALLTGLHPMATGEATYQIPQPTELVKIKWARWDLLDMPQYRAHNWHCLARLDERSPYAVVYTSFGCPFKCHYCNIHAMYSRPYQMRPPSEVIVELEYLASRGVKNIKFADELFAMNRQHVAAVCNGIKDLGFHIWAYAREDTVDGNLLHTMKQAGIDWLAFGFDDKYTTESARRTKTLCDDAGINIIANFMFGLPDDTREQMAAPLAVAVELNFEWVNFYCAFPYPGSQWYDDCLKVGIKLPDRWEHYAQYSPQFMPLDTPHLKGSEILNFRDQAWQHYFSRLEYLDMIEKRFGAREHITGMLGKLVRA